MEAEKPQEDKPGNNDPEKQTEPSWVTLNRNKGLYPRLTDEQIENALTPEDKASLDRLLQPKP